MINLNNTLYIIKFIYKFSGIKDNLTEKYLYIEFSYMPFQKEKLSENIKIKRYYSDKKNKEKIIKELTAKIKEVSTYLIKLHQI